MGILLHILGKHAPSLEGTTLEDHVCYSVAHFDGENDKYNFEW